MNRFARILVVSTILSIPALTLGLSTSAIARDRDSSDSASGKLTPMKVVIDNGTGCHYLTNGNYLEPRMMAHFKTGLTVHMCTGQNGEDALMKTKDYQLQ